MKTLIILLILTTGCTTQNFYEQDNPADADVEVIYLDGDVEEEVIFVDADPEEFIDAEEDADTEEEVIYVDADFQEDADVEEEVVYLDADVEEDTYFEEDADVEEEVIFDLDTDLSNCGEIGNVCNQGALRSCERGVCYGYSPCTAGLGASGGGAEDCNDVCSTLGAIEGTILWWWAEPDGWTRCNDPIHFPPPLRHIPPIIWRCLCVWD